MKSVMVWGRTLEKKWEAKDPETIEAVKARVTEERPATAYRGLCYGLEDDGTVWHMAAKKGEGFQEGGEA
jgi:hypothetical protein